MSRSIVSALRESERLERTVEAIARQAGVLNVHSRYISENVVAYAERLLGTFENHYDQVMFTCTGSESNDQALRIARMRGRGRGIICTTYAYHGNTAAVFTPSPGLALGRGYKIRVATAVMSAINIPLGSQFDQANGFITEALTAGCGASSVVISQVYGGGGTPTANYKDDFVVLYNPTAAAVNLSTYAIVTTLY